MPDGAKRPRSGKQKSLPEVKENTENQKTQKNKSKLGMKYNTIGIGKQLAVQLEEMKQILQVRSVPALTPPPDRGPINLDFGEGAGAIPAGHPTAAREGEGQAAHPAIAIAVLAEELERTKERLAAAELQLEEKRALLDAHADQRAELKVMAAQVQELKAELKECKCQAEQAWERGFERGMEKTMQRRAG
eukprot:scaffold3530_cov101-Isochrysis_galbana.AAC.1